MGYRIKARLLTIRKKIENLNNENYEEIIKLSSNKRNYNDLVYISFEGLREDEIEKIENVVRELKDNDISYRIVEIGEDITDIFVDEYISLNDRNREFPTIYLKREFDDELLEKELIKFRKKEFFAR